MWRRSWSRSARPASRGPQHCHRCVRTPGDQVAAGQVLAAVQAVNAVERVRAAYARIEAVARPEVWIALRGIDEVLAEAAEVDPTLPLAGVLCAVKDNIDVAGLPTTAGAPSFSYWPEGDATAVARLRAAGAIVIGKTNLDQFATGLVGTRSPYGAVRNAWDPARISGRLVVRVGGSGRARHRRLRPRHRHRGLGPGPRGAQRDRRRETDTGARPGHGRGARLLLAGLRDRLRARARAGARCRRGDGRPGPGRRARADRGSGRGSVGPAADRGADRGPASTVSPTDGVRRSRSPSSASPQAGAEIVEVDITPLLDAAALLYEGAFVAERYAAVGRHVEEHQDLIGTDLDPTVASIILGAKGKSAVDWAADSARLAALGAAAREALGDYDALLTPTTTSHPTLAEVALGPDRCERPDGSVHELRQPAGLRGDRLPVGVRPGPAVRGHALGSCLLRPRARRARGPVRQPHVGRLRRRRSPQRAAAQRPARRRRWHPGRRGSDRAHVHDARAGHGARQTRTGSGR